jgi:hypothetical protein
MNMSIMMEVHITMNKKILILIPTVLLIIIAVLYALTLIYRNDSINTTDDPVENLINNSLSIQYGNNNIDPNSVFTEEFIDGIDNNHYFYKDKLIPYQITYKHYNLTEIAENEYVVSVHIEDRNGSYIQVIHIIKEHDCYLISDIEYDI